MEKTQHLIATFPNSAKASVGIMRYGTVYVTVRTDLIRHQNPAGYMQAMWNRAARLHIATKK